MPVNLARDLRAVYPLNIFGTRSCLIACERTTCKAEYRGDGARYERLPWLPAVEIHAGRRAAPPACQPMEVTHESSSRKHASVTLFIAE